MFDVLTDKDTVARKAHKCIWCGEQIDRGTTYRRQTGKFDGDFQSNAWHLDCLDVVDEVLEYADDSFEPYTYQRGSTEERDVPFYTQETIDDD